MGSMVSVQRGFVHVPEGIRYEEKLLSPEEERALMSTPERLQFREFEFRGFLGKRRTVSFGWRYDFNVRELQPTEIIPTSLLALRQKAAEFAGLSADGLQHALVTEYSPGARIGWHKDRPEFADVIGVSLGAPCLLRFRRKQGTRASVRLGPRSAYFLRGSARWDSQHSIPPVDTLRYSITFRSLRESRQ
jgi:alkylated DNA repair dioxygenase AlkB